MRREQDVQMREAKRGYREAVTEGNREEEARWANVIGDILKNRGEYVEALRWLRLDYKVSLKYLPQKQLLPTCQSIGELYLRLDRHHEALHYQKKHLELAKASDDLIEQQRAATQLGRTYNEMFLRSEDDHDALRNAKKYFKSAMKLACILKDNISCFKSSHFLKEYIDAHNNIGMLEVDLDNVEDAEKILLKGLKICDEEEVAENDDGRTRLHHNLGNVYLELRDWAKSKKHIEIDIQICKRIGHPQGEAKGFINLGELHYRVQKYPEATNCYKKALEIANELEDEDALVAQIAQNLDIVKQAEGVLEDLKNEELKLKKLARAACSARGTSKERRYLLEQNTALDSLIDKARLIAAWKKHQEFAKRKKRVVTDLCDKEKMSDSYLVIGESYQKLRNFSKARKWYMKSWNTYRSIGNMEGQALAKINIGEVLDSCGNWAGALEAFEEGYKIAVQGNLPSVQLSALNNMHYSHMIRFDNEEDARKLQHEIQTLKSLLNEEVQPNGLVNEHCPETETEGLDMSDSSSSGSDMPDTNTSKPMTINPTDDIDDDIVLGSLVPPRKAKRKMSHNSCCKRTGIPNSLEEASSDGLSKSSSHKTLSRKRLHVVISDDELDECNAPVQEKEVLNGCQENETTSSKDLSSHQAGISYTEKDVACSNPKDVLSTCTDRGKSTCSSSSKFPKPKAGENTLSESLSDVGGTNAPNSLAGESRMDSHHSGSLQQNQNGHGITFKMGSDLIHVDTSCCMDGDKLSIECLKVQIACQYYLQLPKEKRSKGLLPVFKNLALSETECGLLEISDGQMEIIADEWVPKRLMKSYIDNCEKKSEEPTMNLIKKLYNLEVSEDEIVVSSCGLQDVSIAPFMDALSEHKTVTLLDVSHNALGNETMERLHQLFISSTQTYGSLVLDLHSNRFGPSSLFQICECPVFSARLEVLNVSENRLTDACGSYLTTILTNCKALYSLNIEKCGITTRTIQKIADVLDEGHVLSQLKIGRNSPISGSSVVKLLVKLTKLESFSELGLSTMKLNKNIINSLCQLIRTTSLSTLILDSANLGDEGALEVIEAFPKGIRELVKLDLSNCGLNKKLAGIFTKVASLDGLHELNLGGNSFKQEICLALSPLLNPQSLKILILNKCGLDLNGILEVVKALKGNDSLEELHIADNANCTPEASPQQQHNLEAPDLSKPSNRPEPCNANLEYNDMEVADSEDELTKMEHPFSCLEGAHAGSYTQKPFTCSDIVKELALAIAATRLLLIDLSSNGLSEKTVETLYNAWSSRPGIVAQKHVRQEIVHFSVEGKRCCGVRPCCRRDGLV